jgi:hypothetical protein
MLFRPVDSQGDMLPLQRKGQLLSGVDAVAEAVRSRMRLHKGEWFEDPNVGSPVLDLISNNRISENNLGPVAHQIIGYISETGGVKAVQASRPVYNGVIRAMTIPCTITATSGEQVTLEVSTAQ